MRLGKHEKAIILYLGKYHGDHYPLVRRSILKGVKNAQVLFSQTVKRLIKKGLVEYYYHIQLYGDAKWVPGARVRERDAVTATSRNAVGVTKNLSLTDSGYDVFHTLGGEFKPNE